MPTSFLMPSELLSFREFHEAWPASVPSLVGRRRREQPIRHCGSALRQRPRRHGVRPPGRGRRAGRALEIAYEVSLIAISMRLPCKKSFDG